MGKWKPLLQDLRGELTILDLHIVRAETNLWPGLAHNHDQEPEEAVASL